MKLNVETGDVWFVRALFAWLHTRNMVRQDHI